MVVLFVARPRFNILMAYFLLYLQTAQNSSSIFVLTTRLADEHLPKMAIKYGLPSKETIFHPPVTLNMRQFGENQCSGTNTFEILSKLQVVLKRDPQRCEIIQKFWNCSCQ